MAEELIEFTFNKNFKRQMEDYIEKKGATISKRLKTKMIESAEYVKTMMAQYAPRASGGLVNIIKSLPVSSRGVNISLTNDARISVVIGLNRKKDLRILWADRGTGIYGPNRRVIRPTDGQFMYYEIDGELFRSKTLKGQKGKRFIRSAINASKLIMVSKLRSALKEI